LRFIHEKDEKFEKFLLILINILEEIIRKDGKF